MAARLVSIVAFEFSTAASSAFTVASSEASAVEYWSYCSLERMPSFRSLLARSS